MRHILLKIEYDGSAFSGWQRQPGKRTVQGEIERALSILCRQPVTIDGTGRTDAGVHAYGQCASFHGEFGIPTGRIPVAANAILAESRLVTGDIRILSAEDVEESFHARFHAIGKTYLYRIHCEEEMPVFLRHYRYSFRKPLDLSRMQKAAELLAGTHDFRSFMTDASQFEGSTVRTIHGLSVSKQSSELCIAVTGSGFLYNMVRILTGTLLDIGTGQIPLEETADILAACDRQRAGHTAPPQGLYMAEVYFSPEDLQEGMARYHGETAPGISSHVEITK